MLIPEEEQNLFKVIFYFKTPVSAVIRQDGERNCGSERSCPRTQQSDSIKCLDPGL